MQLYILSAVVVLATLASGLPLDEGPHPDTWFGVSPSRSRRDTTSGGRPPLNPTNHTGNSSVCVDMKPIHGGSLPQTGESPYTMTVDEENVGAGDIVTLTVKGSEPFRGVYCQARRVDTEVPVGEFQPIDDPSVAISDCPPNTNNAILMVGRKDVTELSMPWKSPLNTPRVRFWCTFVKTFNTFWVAQKSPQTVTIW